MTIINAILEDLDLIFAFAGLFCLIQIMNGNSQKKDGSFYFWLSSANLLYACSFAIDYNYLMVAINGFVGIICFFIFILITRTK